MTDTTDKQKTYKLKEGQLLRYKKRLFGSNWQPAHLTLYSNGIFKISTRRTSNPALITCQKNSTLIIFDQILEYIPKRPVPPNGYKKEHMLAIGLIHYATTSGGKLKGVQVIFYWFSMNSHEELIEWVVAFQNSLYSNSNLQNTKSNPDIQTLRNNIALNNSLNIASLNSTINPNFTNNIDDLSLGLLMANTTAFNSNFGNMGSMAALGSAGLLAATAQHQLSSADLETILNNQNYNQNSLPLDFLNQNRNPGGYYLNDYSTIYFADDNNPFTVNEIGDSSFGNDDALPIAEIGTLLSAGAVDFGIDFGDCGVAALSAGGDCGFDVGFDMGIPIF